MSNTTIIIAAIIIIAIILFKDNFKDFGVGNIWKQIKLWSPIFMAPVFVVLFVVIGVGFQEVFKTEDGETAFGFYDPSAIHRAILASSIMEIVNLFFLFTFWWMFRGLFKWFYLNKDETKSSSYKDWGDLSAMNRFTIFMVMYAVNVFAWLYVFKTI